MERTLFDHLYYYQHKLIPSLFFNDEVDYFGTLAEKPEVLFEMFDDACEKAGVTNVYADAAFTVESYRMDDEWFGMILSFPRAEEVPLCFQIYFFIRNDHSGKGCYTLELAETVKGEPAVVLGSWDENETHLNLGCYPMKREDYCAKAFEIHKKNHKGE